VLQVRLFKYLHLLLFSFILEKKSDENKEENKLNGTTDETSDISLVVEDGNDNSGLTKEEISPKRNAQRTAKEKVTKYAGDNDEEDDESIIHGMAMDDDENASDYMGSDSDTEKKIKKTNTKPKQPRKPKSAASDAASPAKKKVKDIHNHLIKNKFTCFRHLRRKMHQMVLRKMLMEHHQRVKQKNRKNL
jgi:hypothetical protein